MLGWHAFAQRRVSDGHVPGSTAESPRWDRGSDAQPPAAAVVKTDERECALPTYTPKPGDVVRSWHVIDASDVVLGRLASQAARLLRGKHKPQFAPHVDTGDFVIIVNADKVAVARRSKRSAGGLAGATARLLCATPS